MKLRKLTVILLVIFTVMNMAGCKTVPIKEDGKETKSSLSGSITIWSYGIKAKALKDTAVSFKEKHPDVTVNIVELHSSELKEKFLNGVASNSNLPDIVNIDEESLPYLLQNYSDSFQVLSDESTIPQKDRFLKKYVSSATVKNKLYALPYDTEPILVYYRKDIFNSLGVKAEDIKTWDNFLDIGRRLKIYSEDRIKLLPSQWDDSDMFLRILISQLNAEYPSNENEYKIDETSYTKALELIRQINSLKLGEQVSSPDEEIEKLKKGIIAAVPAGSSFSGLLQERLPEQSGKWGVMRLPAFEAGGSTSAEITGSSLILLSGTQNKKAAMEFMSYAASDNRVLSNELYKYGVFSCYIPFYDEVVFDSASGYFSNETIFRLFNNVVENSSGLNYHSDYENVKHEILLAQHKTVSSEEEISNILKEIKKQ